jgi:TrmH family RNA methyltransferase
VSADITSPANDRIKWLVRLRSDRRRRDAEGVFIVEGERLYRRALEAGLYPALTFVSTDSNVGTVGETLTVSPVALDKASYRQRSQDLIGVFPQIETRLDHLTLPDDPLLLIAEDIEKPGNLGAMLRTAGAAGADALIAVGGNVDVHNPNLVRASTGSLFTTSLAITAWDGLGPWLDDGGIDVVAAFPEAGDTLWEADLSGPLALVVGAEDAGLSSTALEIADRSVRIPQETGTVDSLNVSVAAGVLLFEARRQRLTS